MNLGVNIQSHIEIFRKRAVPVSTGPTDARHQPIGRLRAHDATSFDQPILARG